MTVDQMVQTETDDMITDELPIVAENSCTTQSG